MNQQPQFTIAELGAKFGSQIAQTLSELITVEKIIESQRLQIEAMAKNEDRLKDHIQDLEDELRELKSENFELRQMRTKKRPLLSPEAAEIAEAGDAIIATANDKAAPV
jgi:chromosome segregation ATPase